MTTKAIKEPWTARLPGPAPDLLALVGVTVLTPVLLFLFGREDVANVAIAYLFGIAFISLRLGHRASIVAAIASAIAFDYFFLFPYHSLVISHVRQLVSFGAMLGTALFISSLNERLRPWSRLWPRPSPSSRSARARPSSSSW
jgi:two-component system, OmpR family, sensor histidine kinase KdpD